MRSAAVPWLEAIYGLGSSPFFVFSGIPEIVHQRGRTWINADHRGKRVKVCET